MIKKINFSAASRKIIICCSLFLSNISYAQTEFFKSDQVFTEGNLVKFFSSVSISGNYVLFNANDYKVYCFNKQTGAELWSYTANTKTNNPFYFYENSVITAIHENEESKGVQLDLTSGKLIHTMAIGPLLTEPFFKNGIMYGTALHDGGKLFAYDLKQNKVIWEQFIAHGVETQPYFLKDKIVANAEADNWFDIDYTGKLSTDCKTKVNIFVEDIYCVRKFKYLTHDNTEIPEKFILKHLGAGENVNVKHHDEKTFISGDDNMVILGSNKKILKTIEFRGIITLPKENESSYMRILKIEGQKIWFLCENILAIYDFEKEKTLKEYELSKWNPYRILPDGNNAWIISKTDGQLYGLRLN